MILVPSGENDGIGGRFRLPGPIAVAGAAAIAGRIGDL